MAIWQWCCLQLCGKTFNVGHFLDTLGRLCSWMVKVLTLQMRSCRFEPLLPYPTYFMVLGGWLNVLSRWDAELRYSAPEDWWSMIAYIVLFSALLSRLPVLACGSTWVTSFFIARFFLLKNKRKKDMRWHGLCHMKLQPSQRKFWVHHTTMHHVTSCKTTYVRCMHV